MADVNADIYQTDLAFDSDLVVTATGDLDVISGLANLKAAILRCVFTSPGSIVHRPNYGVGLKNFLNNINSLSVQQRLYQKINEQLQNDPRVDSVTALSVDSSDDNPEEVTIFLSVKPVGYAEQQISITAGLN